MSLSSYVESLTPSQRRRHEAKRLLTPEKRVEIGLAADWTCAYCARRGNGMTDPDNRPWHLDHVQPLSRGGSNSLDNVVLACVKCNRAKGDSTVAEMLTHISLILDNG